MFEIIENVPRRRYLPDVLVKPKPIAYAVTTPVAHTTAGRSSEPTSGDKASKAASAAKGRRLNNTPKADPRLASRSNTSITGQSSAQEERGRRITAGMWPRSRKSVTETFGTSGFTSYSEKIPCPDAAAHSPSIESSAGKRKRTTSDLDASPQSETAVAEQTKRLKLQQSPQLDTMKQLWDRPRYGISVPASPTVAEMLMSRKAAVEKHFGVRFEYGLHKEELIFYCEPVDIGSMTYNDAVELCEPAFKFLNEFLRNSFGQSGCIDDYLKLSNWVTKEKGYRNGQANCSLL
ncbi:hypothetical protein BTUL_0044g00780 [Botrytis tulipae]|uniref:Uncharacterized protein n=1 Tax=Botrytis tulipae TaxID=87230 RepID=A0A4Z1EUQ2_9HELO|nr:hypothetical protein BTUL_0044g00780 [Botrytis tulipae]